MFLDLENDLAIFILFYQCTNSYIITSGLLVSDAPVRTVWKGAFKRLLTNGLQQTLERYNSLIFCRMPFCSVPTFFFLKKRKRKWLGTPELASSSLTPKVTPMSLETSWTQISGHQVVVERSVSTRNFLEFNSRDVQFIRSLPTLLGPVRSLGSGSYTSLLSWNSMQH